jgi:hypothetical protein
MKTKKLVKKLVLNKESVANLGNQEMNAVHGGYPMTWMVSRCYTCETNVSKCWTWCGETCASYNMSCPGEC